MLRFLLLVYAVIVTCGGVKTDFEAFVKGFRGGGEPVEFKLVESDLVTDICVGSPCQTFKVALDTTSAYIQVPSKTCLEGKLECEAHNKYDWSASHDFKFETSRCFKQIDNICAAIFSYDKVKSSNYYHWFYRVDILRNLGNHRRPVSSSATVFGVVPTERCISWQTIRRNSRSWLFRKTSTSRHYSYE